jgi:hypothetical protein
VETKGFLVYILRFRSAILRKTFSSGNKGVLNSPVNPSLKSAKEEKYVWLE